MAPPLLTLTDIHLTFGGTPLLEGAALSVTAGDRLCLVGRNGSGKSTLLKVAAGSVQADRGERIVQSGVTLRYLPQEPDLSGFDDTLSYVLAGLGPSDDPHRATTLLHALGLTGTENPAQLSGGEARRAALARVIAPEPDILLLDEPTNHLDLPAIEWLESELQRLRSALVLISHDRRFLSNLTRATIWLDRGATRRLEQGFAAFEDWRDALLEQEETERHKLDRKIVAELDWVRHGVSGRRKRNMGRMRALQDLKTERRDQRKVAGNVTLNVSEAETSSKLIAEAKGISKSWGDLAVLKDVSIKIQRGDRLGIIGPNGAGKTTLLNILTGKLAPDSGSIRLGENIALVTLDQKRDTLDPEMTLQTALAGGSDKVTINGQPRHVMSYMKDFLFTPEQARTPLKVLSGGERGRLMLARALARPSNVLVLDEPTNDLDLETLDLLQEMLADYPGTVLLVSHDRDFIDRVCTSVLAAEGEGRWQVYAGGYSDMVAQRGTGVQARAAAAKAAKAETGKGDAVPRAASKRKLSFKDKHALETLPKRIADLQAEIAKHQAMLNDAQLFSRDPAKYEAASKGLEKAGADLAAAEDQWLELEMLREEIEAG
ncbi:MAG: ATP-binding cassette domain-containing protein [Ferrovibrio sp.]|uniref:ABC-F family ATP-binding cassette domain-containing protein n=1 Tax=Ferrovibrio sp. TaxID=1917215 RepID=UPI00260BEFCC|nr:ATP-binding cassette domain-containing protein [Ferrovibrio sp.]MCW0234344.1 ATP-binding cassette domain-containing protein [Ferrovibrio sp.]